MSDRNGLYYIFSVLRLLLYPLALLYGAIVWLRNRLYDAGFSSSVEFSIPVISVGNLSVGGTGKTPHVEYLIRLLQYQFKVATMSRGYKRRTQGFLLADENANALRIGDEPMQYHMKYPEVAVSVAEERITGIPSLLQKVPEVDVVLLDDAYQHRSVKPGVNILITDYSRPFYDDYILPYGRLREGRHAYKRADIIIVSKCPFRLSSDEADKIRARIKPLPAQEVYFTGIEYDQPYELFSGMPLHLAGKNAVLVCCIAKPEPLVAFLEKTCNDVHVLSYPDHHYFFSKDMEEIRTAYENWDVSDKIIVTTEKDATRLHLQRDKLKDWNLPVAVLPIKITVLFDAGPELDRKIADYVEATLAEHRSYGF
ncbi:MAG: tetraacyldisaccharide 4'-kinase [Sphingobacteriales bacterium]|nr:MAG: tetraacyldisaccharide 4'-kinase [Sphingobacteriales bacterium]